MNTSPRRTAEIALLLIGLSFILVVHLTAPRTARANPSVLYAAPTAQGSGDCSSWTNACTLQTALAQAVSGDEIWVRAGVHYPGAASNRSATFTLKNGVALYGGFAGSETSRNARNWQTHKTILSGDIDQNDITDPSGVVTTTAHITGTNAYHVVTGSGTNSSAILDGFIITAGQANDTSDAFGGGMYNASGSPTLINVTFSGNSAIGNGGGMYNWQSNPTLTNVIFNSNSAEVGGGMSNIDSNPTLTNVRFNSNSAGMGGGMASDLSNPTLTNVIFNSNSAYFGGGMSNIASTPTLTNVTFNNNLAIIECGGMVNDLSNPRLTNVTFSGNSAANNGGGMCNSRGSPTLTNVTFSGNSATDGGGMYNWRSNPTLTNATFNSNSAANNGGGIYSDDSGGTLTNVTFGGNSAANNGGGIYNSVAGQFINNVIIWANTASAGPGIYNSYGSNPHIAYSDIQGCGSSGASWNTGCGTDIGGNIHADPLFIDAASGNLRLKGNSPAIDAGNNAAVPAGIVTDLDGNPRFVDVLMIPNTGSGTPPIVDMGAYEARPYVLFLPLARKGA